MKFFIVSVFLIMALRSPVTAEYFVTAYVAIRPVIVDGRWTTTDEWTDSVNVTFGYGALGDRQCFSVKHDSRFLYVLVDFVADTRLDDKDNSWVYLDTKGDGGTAPRNDDYGFGINFVAGQPIFRMKRGTGTGWQETVPSASPPIEGFWAWASMDPSNDPYLSTPHSIYEFRIPKTILEESTAVGFRVVVADELGQVEWPSRTSSLSPSKWGTLTLSVVSIMERRISRVLGAIFLDCNGNGKQDKNEPPVGPARVAQIRAMFSEGVRASRMKQWLLYRSENARC
jgi:hypothetical protein